VKHVVEVYNLFYRVRRPGLLSVPKSGVGDEDLIRGIGKHKFIIESYLANLIVWEDTSIEVGLLDIQERKWLYGMLALKCLLLSVDGHICSLILGKN
jgi:hypothetical protein